MLRRRKAALVYASLATFVLTAAGAQAPVGKEDLVSPATVAAALGHAGVTVSAVQIQIPPGIYSHGAPNLEITGAEALPDGRLRVRLTCARRDCLPFLVLVDVPGGEANQAAETLLSGFHPDLPIRSADLPRVQVGEHAMLLLEDAHMRILIPVLAIDSGSVGSEVRVSSLDRKQVFRGTVLSAEMVKGELP